MRIKQQEYMAHSNYSEKSSCHCKLFLLSSNLVALSGKFDLSCKTPSSIRKSYVLYVPQNNLAPCKMLLYLFHVSTENLYTFERARTLL